jgi:hypothetical protein
MGLNSSRGDCGCLSMYWSCVSHTLPRLGVAQTQAIAGASQVIVPIPIIDGPEAGHPVPEAGKIQWYFMHPLQDVAAGEKLSDFFVTTSLNANGCSIAGLHQLFYEKVGGISATVVAGNHAGYVGGLTANLAIAKAFYKPSAPNSACVCVGRSVQELRQALQDAYVELAKTTADSQELSSEIVKNVQKKVDDIPVGGGTFSFRDYTNMRTGRCVKSVIKGNDTPFFGPPAWEELNSHLRRLAFASADAQMQQYENMRAFCSESDEQLRETCPDGNIFLGRPLVQCVLQSRRFVCADSNGPLHVPDETSKAIQRCMAELGVVYSNAVFEGVNSIEDSGFAFMHVYSFDMAEDKYRHQRNKAIVYTCGPNGNKARYPDDVHVRPSVQAWHERTRLVGQNVAKSVAAYNTFIEMHLPSSLLPVTILRTALISGGAFMLRDEANLANLLVSFEDHACSYQQGLLQGLQRCPDAKLKRIEFMHTKMKPEDEELFQASFKLALARHSLG